MLLYRDFDGLQCIHVLLLKKVVHSFYVSHLKQRTIIFKDLNHTTYTILHNINVNEHEKDLHNQTRYLASILKGQFAEIVLMGNVPF